MNLVPMRFKGVEWHHNPREISFSCEQSVNEFQAPYGKTYTAPSSLRGCSR